MFTRRCCFSLMVLAGCLVGSPHALAAQSPTDEKTAKVDFTLMDDLKVKVVNDQGDPVANCADYRLRHEGQGERQRAWLLEPPIDRPAQGGRYRPDRNGDDAVSRQHWRGVASADHRVGYVSGGAYRLRLPDHPFHVGARDGQRDFESRLRGFSHRSGC